MSFNENGYLPAGFHDWSLQQVDTILVQGFPGSQTRAAIAEGYSRLIAELARVGIRVEQWLGGPFCTAAMNPSKLDLVSIIDKEALDSLPLEHRSAVTRLFLGPASKAEFLCDSYICVKVPEAHPQYGPSQQAQAYWKGEWGFCRSGFEKGIVRVQAGKGAFYPGGARGGV